VFFVRVASKGLMLDAASRLVNAGVALMKERSEGDPPPPVFCKRVRKLLIGKEMWEYSFLKSAEEIEKEGFNF
jgi:hypothetical protein